MRTFQTEIEKLDRQIATKEADVARLRQSVSDYQRRVDAVPGHESELTALMRDYETLQKIYTSLLAKKEDSKISANLERQQVGEQFKILDPARLPETAVQPEPAQIDARRRRLRPDARARAGRRSSSIATRRCAPRTRS